MELLLDFAGVLGPAVAGLVTVPTLNAVKRASSLIDRTPPTVKQLLGLAIAFGLTKLGAITNTVLPPALELFDGSHTEALLAAGIAFAVHAGKRKVSQ